MYLVTSNARSNEDNDLFTERSLIYNLRISGPLQSYESGLNNISYSIYSYCSLFYTTSRLEHFWNLLPLELRNSPTLTIFRNGVR